MSINAMHEKSGLRVVLKWEIFRPDSVIAAVISLHLWPILVFTFHLQAVLRLLPFYCEARLIGSA